MPGMVRLACTSGPLLPADIRYMPINCCVVYFEMVTASGNVMFGASAAVRTQEKLCSMTHRKTGVTYN